MWKTGTSQKYRDAWTIGYGKNYTLGVWAGNFDGRPNDHLIGQDIAAPIFFEILGNLENKYDFEECEMPGDLEIIEVCPLSGKIATENCDDSILSCTLRENSFTEECDIHKKILIEEKTGLRITGPFKGMGRLVSKVFVIYPSDVREYMRDKLLMDQKIPSVHPGCAIQYTRKGGIEIISPKHDTVYYATSSGDLPLKAVSKDNPGDLFWFLDGKFYKKTPYSGYTLGAFPAGRHTVMVINEAGKFASSDFHVIR